jgi:hypothetical protein
VILLVVGGLVAAGLHQLVPATPVYIFGLIPFGIGIVLLLTPFINRRRG